MPLRLLATSFLFLLIGVSLAPLAQAQQRPSGSVYLQARVGFALYQGDLDGNPESRLFGTYTLRRANQNIEYEGYFPSASPGGGLEIGYQFKPELAVGLAYHVGRYEAMKTAPSPLTPAEEVAFNATSDVHELQLRVRYTLFAQARIAPFMTYGAAVAFRSPATANPDGSDEVGWAPLLGVGLDIKLSPRLALIGGLDFRLFFPDDALDGANFGEEGGLIRAPAAARDDDADYDLLSYLGAGLRYTFKSPVIPLDVTIDGPDTLLVGEVGTFTGDYNRNATPPLSFQFDFGDGASLGDLSPNDLVGQHAYDATGTYIVGFTGVGPINSDVASKPVVVIAAPPVIACAANPTVVVPGEPVQFSAEVTGTPPFSYLYDFGDGMTSAEPRPLHTFSEPGTYFVTLTVTNEAGSATCPFEIVVEAPMCTIEELNTVFFDTDSAVLNAEARSRLDENVALLVEEAPCCAIITGYAHRCERYGPEGEENPEALAAARAEAVLEYYVEQGVGRERLTTRFEVVGDIDEECPKTRKQREREEFLFSESDARRAESAPIDCSMMVPGASTDRGANSEESNLALPEGDR